jgi:hypothetical protein
MLGTLSTMFRRRLLRDARCVPMRMPGCESQVYMAAYPRAGIPTPAAIAQELAGIQGGKLRLPTLNELMRSIKQAARKAANLIYSMGNAYETALLTLEFNNTNLATIGDATGLRGSSTAGSFYIGLHTADVGEAGDATTNEATFTGYARVPVARSSGGWTISGNSVSNAAAITFSQNTGSDQTVTHSSISAGTDGTGSEVVVRYGPLVASGATWLPFSAKTDDTITIPGNPFSVDDRIVLAAAYDGTLPTGITQGTVYWVKTSSGNDITISTTQGGSTLDITAVGSGVCIKAKPLAVRGGIDAVQFAAGTMVCKID